MKNYSLTVYFLKYIQKYVTNIYLKGSKSYLKYFQSKKEY